MIRNIAVLLFAFSAAALHAQETIDIDEESVTADFDLKECRKAAKNLAESLVCTAKKMAYDKKFYEDGTLRSADPNRGDRKWQAYLESRRSVFECPNGGKVVLREEGIVFQQNKLTGEYVITSEAGEVRYTPAPGDLCRVKPLD